MRTNKDLLIKGIKRLLYTVLLMFSAPYIVWQAFKNTGHPFYWPVLIIGLLLGIAAIIMGFLGIKSLMDALFGKQKD
ncbi:DUF6095 family protein [Maribacter sp. 2304DJ31-5]|uniref:DUF6095 family protein n=1 Tax=Maribacter sp. 2304DJ31-5 TaxID=3386273 RepID=UPI0039BCD3EF